MITEYVCGYVKECYSKSILGADMFEQHILVVHEYALKLAKILGADREIVELAAYLHDLSVVFDINTVNVHHIASAEYAEKVLMEQGYPNDKILKVKSCILNHSAPVQIGINTNEEVCLANADAISQMLKPAYWLYVSYIIWKRSYAEGLASYKDWMNNNWNGLSNPGKELVEENYRYLKQYL